jgi:hypothetical protein
MDGMRGGLPIDLFLGANVRGRSLNEMTRFLDVP